MKAFEQQPEYRRTVLKNGIRVVTENHPYSRAVCVGIVIDLGSRDEPKGMYGAAHFIEHMVFKGTKTKDAFQISHCMEAVGGELNAYTTKEQTCFHAYCLKEDLPKALDLLSDLMSNASFESIDFKRERDVILQEMSMTNDEPEEVAYDIFFREAYRKHALGRPIIGLPDTILGITRNQLFDFYKACYYGKNMIVSVAGHVDHEAVCSALNKTINLNRKVKSLEPRKKPRWRSFAKAQFFSVEQVHIVAGIPCTNLYQQARYEAYILNCCLGGGMTSRLFQKVREDKGLCYSIYSIVQPFVDVGMLNVYAATSPKNMQQVLKLILKELEKLKKNGLSRSELKMCKTQVIGSLILDADELEGRMNALAANESLFRHEQSLQDVIESIEAIDKASMQNFLDQHFDLSKLGLVVVGDVDEEKTEAFLKSLL